MTNQMTRFKPCQFKSPLADIRKLECYVSKQNYLAWMNKYPDPIISYRLSLIEVLYYTNSLSLDLHFFNVTNNQIRNSNIFPMKLLILFLDKLCPTAWETIALLFERTVLKELVGLI